MAAVGDKIAEINEVSKSAPAPNTVKVDTPIESKLSSQKPTQALNAPQGISSITSETQLTSTNNISKSEPESKKNVKMFPKLLLR